ncbi:hypothetical protein DPMN_012971 [Dreissena polymorpha]|uniref:Uncharacterized protein n=1 Tax=Dreissena polymorpha TaxID=45954 RepID=A0A9D4N6V4_DREPO|nr:hypothetical protein DPMN_012971 [Dreissena polymorpha]
MSSASVTTRHFQVLMAAITKPPASAPMNTPNPWAETERAMSAEEHLNCMRRSTSVSPPNP